MKLNIYKRASFIFALSVLSLSSCSNDEDFAPQHNALPEDGEIRISASVNQLVATRAETGSTSGETVSSYDGETLGLYIRPASATSWTHKDRTEEGSVANEWYTYPNVKFTNNGSEWSQNDYSQMLWKDAKETYEYYAYAPYDEKAVTNGNKIKFDLKSQQTDLLWASKTDKASSLVNEDGKLDIKFGHVFCQVKVNITLADEFYQNGSTANPISKVVIHSERASGYINVTTGNVFNDSENEGNAKYNPQSDNLTIAQRQEPGNIAGTHTAGNSTQNGTYTSPSIFYAPGHEKFTVTITTSDRVYTYTHNKEADFVAGTIYTINLKMGKNVVQMGAISASKWNQEVPVKKETE